MDISIRRFITLQDRCSVDNSETKVPVVRELHMIQIASNLMINRIHFSVVVDSVLVLPYQFQSNFRQSYKGSFSVTDR